MEETARTTPVSLEPLDDYVVIEPVDEEVETRTGLIIPPSDEAALALRDRHRRRARGGRHRARRQGALKDAGFEVRLAGVAMKVLRRGQLIARIQD